MKSKKIISLIVGVMLSLSCIPPAIVSASTNDVSVEYTAHVQRMGWQGWVSDGEQSGTTGQSLRLEGIRLKVKGDPDLKIEYSAHVQNIGWQGYVSDDALAGTTGKSKRLEAIKIRLAGKDADKYDVCYRVHVQHSGWQNWVKNDEAAGTTGKGLRVEGIQVKITPKNNEEESNIKYIGSVNTSLIDNKTYDDDINITGHFKTSNPVKTINIYSNGELVKSINKESNTNEGDFSAVIETLNMMSGKYTLRTEIIDIKDHKYTEDKNITIDNWKKNLDLKNVEIKNNALYINGYLKACDAPVKQLKIYIDDKLVKTDTAFSKMGESIGFHEQIDTIGMFIPGSHVLTMVFKQDNGNTRTVTKTIELYDYKNDFDITGDTKTKQEQFKDYYKLLSNTRIVTFLATRGYKIYLFSDQSAFYDNLRNRGIQNAIAYTSIFDKTINFNAIDMNRKTCCLHEIGHAFDNSLGSMLNLSYISKSNDFINIFQEEGTKLFDITTHYMETPQEYFAQTFQYYFEKPNLLKEKAPKTYTFIDKYVSYFAR